jgi:methyl-accepting chemotaxis protein
MKRTTINKKIVVMLGIVLILIVGSMLSALLLTEEHLKFEKTKEYVDELSKTTIQSVTFSMSEGTTDISPFVERLKKIKNIRELRILATDKIREKSIEKLDSNEKKVVRSKISLFIKEQYKNEDVFRLIEPILAEKKCIECHNDAQIGDPMATISVRYSIEDTYKDINSQRLNATLMAIGTIIIIFVVILFFLKKQVIKDLLRVVDNLKILSTGDINVSISSTRNDEIGDLIFSLNKLQNSLKNQAESATQIADGHLNIEIPLLSNEDVLGKAMNKVKNNLTILTHDTEELCRFAAKGDLTGRADFTKHHGDYQNIVKGINSILDNVIGPLNVAAEYVDRISKGDIPRKITDNYKGDFNEIKNNLNQCIDAVNNLVYDALMLSQSAEAGKLDARADISKHSGDFRKIILGVNKTLDHVIGPLNIAAEYVDRISKGDIPPKINDDYQGDFNEIKNNLNQCIDAVQLLVQDSNMLVNAAIAEKFDIRADALSHSGDFRKIIDGVNQTLDVVVNKIFWFEQLLDAIPNPVSVTDMDMNWTFINKAAEGIAGKTRSEILGIHCSNWGANICGTENCGIHGLRNGKATSFFNQPGLDMDFKVDSAYILNADGEKIGHIEVVNDITEVTKKAEYNKVEIERISQNLKLISAGNFNIDLIAADADNYTESERQNFLVIYKNLETAKDSIVALANDTMMLANSAIEGKLEKRADPSKHLGEFRKIIEAVNKTLDNVIGPLNMAAEYVDRISNGDIPRKINDEFKGDFNGIKNNLNQCIDAVNALVSDARMLTKAAEEGQLDTRADALRHNGDFRVIIAGVNRTLDNVIGPLNVAAEYVERMSKGNIPKKIDDEYKGDFNEIKNNLNNLVDATNMITDVAKELSIGNTNVTLTKRSAKDFMIDNLIKVIDNNKNNAQNVQRMASGDLNIEINVMSENDLMAQSCVVLKNTLQNLVSDAMMLAKSAKEGRLDTRADVSRHQGDFKEIIIGVNKTLDNVIGPLNVAAEYVDRISKGDMPPKITDDYKGDFNEIKNNINSLIDSINDVTNIANEISNGNLNNTITLRSASDKLMIAMQTMTHAIHDLADDTFTLSQAAVEGKLDIRADVLKHKGDFRTIVEGVNKTLDSVILPLNVAAEYVNRIAKGEIPPKIEDEYQGDFNAIKNNLNLCIEAVNNLVYDTAALADAAVNGRLNERADVMKHSGDFREIVSGVNKTLDNVIGPLNVAAQYVDKISKGEIPLKISDDYQGDFNLIKNNINLLIDSINNVTLISQDIAKGKLDNEIILRSPDDKLMIALQTMTEVIQTLVTDVYSLSQSAIAGQLEKRADSSKHHGDFQSIVDGINKTLDNILEPIMEAGEVLSIIANGDLTTRMMGDYKGDLKDLKMNINQLASSLTDVISQIREAVEQSATAATEISATAESLAAASHQQSSQADDVASAVEEMSRTVIENARSASHTADVAKKNGIVAEEGAKVVEQTVKKMRDIATVVQTSADNIKMLGESSQKIGEIVSVIDDIADQTNLLALNAAIEAARAGEQGRGFAVVADEVRKLAERTTSATKEIAKMIKGIQSETDMAVKAMNQGTIEVQNGIILADQAGNSLENILNSTNVVLDMINQIATASEQQSATSEEIAKNVMSISKVTAESTIRVEEVAHTSENLAAITDHLKKLMDQFKIENESKLSYKHTKQLLS